MIRHTLASIVAFAVLAFAGTAFAQGDADSDTDQKFYNFEQHVVDGEINVPEAQIHDRRDDVEFDRLGKIKKKSFLDNYDAKDKDSE